MRKMPLTIALLAVLAPVATAQNAPPPATNIYELYFNGTLPGLADAKVQVVSTEPGYDNQPSYTPDGKLVLFTGNRDGKQTDIYSFDRALKRVTRVTTTSEGEYSPTYVPGSKPGKPELSVIRVEADGTQRLWQFNIDGTNPRVLLTDIKPVGYHAWIDDDQLALFVLGKPATLQHARLSTGAAKVIAENIGRSLHPIPGTQAVSFVHRESADNVWVKRFDPATGALTPLVRLPAGSQDNDVAWMPDGTLLRSAGTKILSWRRGDKDWQEVYDVQGQKLGNVTRMAVAPDGKALAIVVSEGKN